MRIVVDLPAPATDVAALTRFVGRQWPHSTVSNDNGALIIEVPERGTGAGDHP